MEGRSWPAALAGESHGAVACCIYEDGACRVSMKDVLGAIFSPFLDNLFIESKMLLSEIYSQNQKVRS